MSCSGLGRVEDRVSLKWNYEYSSDVIHAVLISNDVSETNSGACKVHYSTFEVIESFKGGFQKTDFKLPKSPFFFTSLLGPLKNFWSFYFNSD